MRKIISVLLSFAIFAGAVAPLHAQGERLNINQQQAQRNRSEKFLEILRRVYDKTSLRANRYEEFLNRLQERRNVLNEQGKDVTELDSAIRVARSELANTRADISQAKVTFEQLELSTDRDTIRVEVRAQINSLRQSFTTLHNSVKQALAISVSINNNN